MAGIPDPFAASGAPAKAKFLILGSPEFPLETLMNRARSLNIEHVSPARPKGPEISRPPVNPGREEATNLTYMRRWFFARKPDAGFVLTDFPATLLQAQVFDEWLESRDEALSAVFLAGPGSNPNVVDHYRILGLLHEADEHPFSRCTVGLGAAASPGVECHR